MISDIHLWTSFKDFPLSKSLELNPNGTFLRVSSFTPLSKIFENSIRLIFAHVRTNARKLSVRILQIFYKQGHFPVEPFLQVPKIRLQIDMNLLAEIQWYWQNWGKLQKIFDFQKKPIVIVRILDPSRNAKTLNVRIIQKLLYPFPGGSKMKEKEKDIVLFSSISLWNTTTNEWS